MNPSSSATGTDTSLNLPIKVTINPVLTNLPSSTIITVSVLTSLHVRWLGQAVATRIQDMSKQSHVALIPKQVTIIYNNLNEILSPNLKISEIFSLYRLPENVLSSSLSSSSSPPILIELQALSEYQPSALHTVRLPDASIPRTVWQACAFNQSETGRQAITSSLKLSSERQQRYHEEETIRQYFRYVQRTAGTYGAFVNWLDQHNGKELPDHEVHKYGTLFSTSLPWLPQLETIATELKDNFKIKVCLLTHYTDLCRLFQRFGTCHGNNINDVSQYTMQYNQFLHFCQVANMFPIPVSSVKVEETFQLYAVPVTKATVTLTPQGTQQSKQKHSPVKALTILSFLHALIIIADYAFTNEVNLQTGGKNGPGRAMERMMHDHILPVSARIVSGATRRMVHDVSNRRWLELYIPTLRNIFAYYAEVDENLANAVQQSFEQGNHHPSHQPVVSPSNPVSPSKTSSNESVRSVLVIDFPTLYRERRSIRLNEFAKLIVDAGLAPSAVLNPNNNATTAPSSQNSKTSSTATGYTLTMSDIRAAYYGALGLTDAPEYGTDYSGRAREDDPYERLASVDELVEALVRIGYYRWASTALLDINLDAPLDELDRTKKTQANLRKRIQETAEVLASHQLTLLGPKDPRQQKNTVTTAISKSEEEEQQKKAAKLLPRNTRRGSILVDQIITVEHNLVRRGSVVGLHAGNEKSSSPPKPSPPVETGPKSYKPKPLVILKPSKEELQTILMTPRSTAAHLMNTLQSADNLEKPTRAAEIEIYANFMRYVIEAVTNVIHHLGKPVPKLVTYDIPALVKRLNIEAVTVTATLTTDGRNTTNSNTGKDTGKGKGGGGGTDGTHRPSTAFPSIEAFLPLPTIPSPIMEYKDSKHKHTVTKIIDNSDQIWSVMFEPLPQSNRNGFEITVIIDDPTTSTVSTEKGKGNSKGNTSTSKQQADSNNTLYEMEEHALGIHPLVHAMQTNSIGSGGGNNGNGTVFSPLTKNNPSSSSSGLIPVSHLKPEKDIQKVTTPVKNPFSFRI